MRTSLDSLDGFFRALDLYYGRPVHLNYARFDRYNLSSSIFRRNIPRVALTAILACLAYSVELFLEFSSTAEGNEFSLPGRVELYYPTHRACAPLQLDRNNTMQLLLDMASSCVDVSGTEYKFFNASWQRQNSSVPVPVCVHTRDNVLAKDDTIYENLNYLKGSTEEVSLTKFREKISAHSWESNGDKSREVTIFRQTNSDVTGFSRYESNGRKYVTAVLLTQVENTDIFCVGTVFGREGENLMSSRMYGCIGRIQNGFNYIEIAGTSLIEEDAMHLESKSWSTLIAARRGTDIFNFTSGVTDYRDMESVQAFVMLLSSGYGKDVSSINKYAVVYKHCGEFLVPQSSDTFRTMMFDKASSEHRITAAIYEWGLVILIVWPILLSTVSYGFHRWGRKKNLPTAVQGEGSIGRRWLSRDKNRHITEKDRPLLEQSEFLKKEKNRCRWFVQPKKVFLRVEIGEMNDDIRVASEAVNVTRDTAHSFKEI